MMTQSYGWNLQRLAKQISTEMGAGARVCCREIKPAAQANLASENEADIVVMLCSWRTKVQIISLVARCRAP